MKAKIIKKVNPEETKVSEIITPQIEKECELPIFMESVSAGFPSPADDYIDNKLDLNEFLIKNPSATFFVRVTGDSMVNAGIYSGDILVVDRSIEAKNGHVIIAVIDGELLVKRLRQTKKKIFLYPENSNFTPIEITSQMNFEVWGVVTNVIHSLI